MIFKNFKNSNCNFKKIFLKKFLISKFITEKKTGFDVPFKQIVDIYNKNIKQIMRIGAILHQ